MNMSIRHAGIISTLMLGGTAAFAACYDFYDNPMYTPSCVAGAVCGWDCANNTTVISGEWCELPVSLGTHTAICDYGYVYIDPVFGCICVPDSPDSGSFTFVVGTPGCLKLCGNITPGGGED